MKISSKVLLKYSFISKAFTWCIYMILTIYTFIKIIDVRNLKYYMDNMAYDILSRLKLLDANSEISTTNCNARKELNFYPDNESKNEDHQISKKYVKDKINAETERSHVIKCNKHIQGFTGKIKCYKSPNEGIIEFKIKKHIFNSHIFKGKVVNCSKHKQNLCELLPIETVVHFDAKWNHKSDSYKVTKLWSGCKYKSIQKNNNLEENSDELHPRKVYKAIVTIVNKHSFVATVTDNLKSFSVFVKGNLYQPSFTSNCLKREEQVNLFVKVGDEVLMNVRKVTEKHFNHSWYAVKAWKQSIPEKQLLPKVCANNFKIGTVTDVSEVEGTLTFDGFYLQFYNFSSHLFGVNLDGTNLDEIFREGDKLRFIPGSDMLIAQVWHGDTEVVDDIYKRFTEFCSSRCVPLSTVSKLTMKLADLKTHNDESLRPVRNKTEPKKSKGRQNKCSVVKEIEQNISGMKGTSKSDHPIDCSNMFLLESDIPNLQVHEQDCVTPQFTDRSTQTISTGNVIPLTTQVLQQILWAKNNTHCF